MSASVLHLRRLYAGPAGEERELLEWLQVDLGKAIDRVATLQKRLTDQAIGPESHSGRRKTLGQFMVRMKREICAFVARTSCSGER